MKYKPNVMLASTIFETICLIGYFYRCIKIQSRYTTNANNLDIFCETIQALIIEAVVAEDDSYAIGMQSEP